MNRLIALFALSLFAFAASAAEFSSLEERMTRAEFQAAGLDKLSPEELRALNAWLAREMGQQRSEGAAMMAEDNRGFNERGGARTQFTARVVGEFRGWSGGTRFELDNGEVWVQAEPGELSVGRMQSPLVTITPGAFGVWRLQVEGYNSSVKVQRVR
jgi:hypothetical protein